jgi:hypothetical protein
VDPRVVRGQPLLEIGRKQVSHENVEDGFACDVMYPPRRRESSQRTALVRCLRFRNVHPRCHSRSRRSSGDDRARAGPVGLWWGIVAGLAAVATMLVVRVRQKRRSDASNEGGGQRIVPGGRGRLLTDQRSSRTRNVLHHPQPTPTTTTCCRSGARIIAWRTACSYCIRSFEPPTTHSNIPRRTPTTRNALQPLDDVVRQPTVNAQPSRR